MTAILAYSAMSISSTILLHLSAYRSAVTVKDMLTNVMMETLKAVMVAVLIAR